jgi:anti-anti-sigma factor
MSASLDVQMTMVDGRCVIRPVGDVDLSTAPDLARALHEAHGAIEVDCTGLRFIDAAGFGVLSHTASTNGSLVLTGTGPFLRQALQAAGLEHLIAADAR